MLGKSKFSGISDDKYSEKYEPSMDDICGQCPAYVRHVHQQCLQC